MTKAAWDDTIDTVAFVENLVIKFNIVSAVNAFYNSKINKIKYKIIKANEIL